MDYRLPRPARTLDPAAGLLRAEHFQMAYVTNDIAQACDVLGAQLGITAFASLDGPLAPDGHMHARFAWVGTIMYELLEASGSDAGLYTDLLEAADGFRMRHHHLGFLAHDRAQFDAALAQARMHGWAIPHVASNPLVDVCFVAVPALGHYLEYLLPTQAGLHFFDAVPRH